MEESTELRAYFFNIMYLQGIHAGIQAQHCTAEMFVRYVPFQYKQSDMLYGWANHHKTTIILNGGYASNLERIMLLLQSKDNKYPWAHFCESKEALNSCITSVGIILPDKVFRFNEYCTLYNLSDGLAAAKLRLSNFEVLLAKEISSCRLMN